MVIAAAGALSVATAASATAVTWSQEAQGHADGPAEITNEAAIAREAAGPLRLTVADQLAGPVAETADEQSNATWMRPAFRLTTVQDAIAQRKAVRKAAVAVAARAPIRSQAAAPGLRFDGKPGGGDRPGHLRLAGAGRPGDARLVRLVIQRVLLPGPAVGARERVERDRL